MKSLRRYWFSLEESTVPDPLNLGCGITAFDCDDAIVLLQERVIRSNKGRRIVDFIEDVDVSTLDQSHVAPNMGSVLIRGVWFPRGYENK